MSFAIKLVLHRILYMLNYISIILEDYFFHFKDMIVLAYMLYYKRSL